MLLAVILGFCSTSILALHHEAHKLFLRQSPQLQSANNANVPLQLYNTNNIGPTKVQETNNLLGGQYRQSTYSANSGDFLKNLNTLVNLLPQNGALQPEKLQYVLPVFENIVAKSPTNNYKLSNTLLQLKELSKASAQDNLAKFGNEENAKVKVSLEYNLPTAQYEKCQNILGVLIDYINTAYKQIGQYCEQSGQCDASMYANINKKIPLILNSYVQNTIPNTQQITNGYSSIYGSQLTKLANGNNNLDNLKKNIETKQEYDILSILQNSVPKPELNELRDSPNDNILNIQKYSSDIVPKYTQTLNLHPNTNNPDTLTGLNYNLQTLSPYKIPKAVDLNTMSVQEVFSLLKTPSEEYLSQHYETPDANINHLNFNRDGDLVEHLLQHPSLLNLENTKNGPNKIDNVGESLTYTQLGLQQHPLIYEQTSPTNIATEEFQSTGSPNLGLLDTKQNLLDNIKPLRGYQSSIFQINQPAHQDNVKRLTEAITKIDLHQSNYNPPITVNTSPYLQDFYNQLISSSAHLNQPGLGSLNIPDAKSQQNIYVSPNVINTLVRDNNKQVNYGNQLPDLSRLLGVSNSVKLNSVPNQSEVVELTYKIKRPTAAYEPSYFVKYRLPYKQFFDKMQNILAQNSHLRTTQPQLYLELLNDSQLAETSTNLKGINHDELLKLIANSGALVDAKLLKSNALRTAVDEQLQIIKDINANLSFPNLHVNATDNEDLGVIQKLVNATETAVFDVPATTNSFSLFTSNAQTPVGLNGYVKPQTVYQPSLRTYNPYSPILNPIYSSRNVRPQSYYTLPSTGYYYQNLYKNIAPVKTVLPTAYSRNIYSQNLISSYPQIFG